VSGGRTGQRTLAVALALTLAQCGGSPKPAPRPPEPKGSPIDFLYGTTDGAELSSSTTRGRATALLFVTTYDLLSQLEARQLDDVVRRHRPRANAGAIVLETPKYAVLADSFKKTLGLSYPVAIADDETRQGGGPFGRVAVVPTLVVLDRRGRETFRKPGLAAPRDIEQALGRAERFD